jgi:hydroxymethylbilane synthase
MAPLVIATRGSKLALAQARWVAGRLAALRPGLEVELKVIKTKGDKITDVPLAAVGGKGLFVKEIEEALLAGRAQLAVHSMKDVPAELPPGLVIAGVSPRQDVRDVLVSRRWGSLEELPPGARVGTSSLRRRAQLLARRPDLEVVPLRGNVETRLRKLDEQGLDAVILAAAGLARLGLEQVATQYLPVETLLPAVGQGALGLECREDDAATRELVAALADPAAAAAVEAERAFLGRLEGGCQVPIAAHAVLEGDRLWLRGLVADLEGRRLVRAQGRAPRAEAAALGRQVAEEVLESGGREILAQVYGEAPR